MRGRMEVRPVMTVRRGGGGVRLAGGGKAAAEVGVGVFEETVFLPDGEGFLGAAAGFGDFASFGESGREVCEARSKANVVRPPIGADGGGGIAVGAGRAGEVASLQECIGEVATHLAGIEIIGAAGGFLPLVERVAIGFGGFVVAAADQEQIGLGKGVDHGGIRWALEAGLEGEAGFEVHAPFIDAFGFREALGEAEEAAEALQGINDAGGILASLVAA